MIPWGADDQRPDGDWLDGLTLRVFGGASTTSPDVRSVTVPDLTGATAASFRVVRDGEGLTVTSEGTDRPYRVVAETTGARAEGTGSVTLHGA